MVGEEIVQWIPAPEAAELLERVQFWMEGDESVHRIAPPFPVAEQSCRTHPLIVGETPSQ
jgi:hypothetical protein